jgi:hypothetical protein
MCTWHLDLARLENGEHRFFTLATCQRPSASCLLAYSFLAFVGPEHKPMKFGF